MTLKRTFFRYALFPMVIAMCSAFALASSAQTDDPQAASEGLLPVPEYGASWKERGSLTGDWGGVRQRWAERGITFEVDWSQFYQDVVDGGVQEGGESSANLDYWLHLDLMRMGAVPGALVTARGQSRFGSTVNDTSGVLLPVNMYSSFPFGEGDVDIALTELNWTQFLSEQFGLLAGKITTVATANEFMGGQGRTQFMNFQFNFPAVLAQLAPYSTLAATALWMPNPNWTVASTLMNLQDASTSSGFDDIGDGTTWATTADYLGSLNELPGGGTFAFYYGFDAEFAELGGLHLDPTTGSVAADSKSEAWAASWHGWQYLLTEEGDQNFDPRNGRQDLQGLGLFAQLGVGDKDTNPVAWSLTGGLSGRGSIPSRDDDTWGLGYFYNELGDLKLGEVLALTSSTQGLELYYDIHLAGWASLTLDAQWAKSGFQSVGDATLLAARLNFSF